MTKPHLGASVAVCAMMLAWAGQAQAQEQSQTQPQAATSDSGDTLGDIVVTAQKRETRLERTPMTINVVSGEQLADAGTLEIKSLAASVPGLAFDESPGGLSGVGLRGVGTSAGSQVFEQSVGLFVDGIYHPRARQFRDALFDVQRVEVVKGSQGVLFGKNTSVGAISVISRDPGSQMGGYLQGQYETNYGSYALEGGIDLTGGGNFGVRLSGLYNHDDGFVRNVTLNRDEPAGNRYVLRAVAVWEPSDSLRIRGKTQFSRMRLNGTNFEFVANQNVATLQALGVADGGLEDYVKYETGGSVGNAGDYQRGTDNSLEIRYDLGGDYSLTATTGYTQFTFHNTFDSDSTPATYLLSKFNENFRQFSQEVRLTSPANRPIEFIVGGFYLHSTIHYNYLSYYNNFPVAGGLYGTTSQHFDQAENTFAGFGQATFHLADNLQFLAGGRLTTDKKVGEYQRFLLDDLGHPTGLVALLGNGPYHRVPVRDTTFDFSGTLSYNATPTSTLYASIGRGNKGSGFVNQSAIANPYPNPFVIPVEQVTTYEAGFKGRVLGGRGYFSIAAYHLDIHDYQDSFYNSTARAFQVRSLDARSSGMEAEAQMRVARGITTYGNIAWNPQAKLENGERMQRSPRFTSTLGARFETDLSESLGLSGFGQWVHSSNFLHQPASAPGDNTAHAHDLLSARLELTYRPAQVSLFVNAANITKEVYRTFSFGSPLGIGQVGALNDPRTFTIGIRKEF